MKQKGQASLEFVFLILIIIIYIFTVTRPLSESAISAVEDIQEITQASKEAAKITETINNISLLAPTSRETLTIVVPDNTTLYCYNEGKIGFSSQINIKKINPAVNICPNDLCDKNYTAQTPIGCLTNQIKGVQKIVITKSDNNVIISRG